MAADIDETPRSGESPRALVERLAREKARAVALRVGDADGVVAADTVVALGDEILNKPVDDADARRMLMRLSGRTHQAITGFCVLHQGAEAFGVVATDVTFRVLDDTSVNAWIGSGRHMDKAGAYGIQHGAGALVDTVMGSYTNIVGLPVREVLAALSSLGVTSSAAAPDRP
jgi:septum formation protein